MNSVPTFAVRRVRIAVEGESEELRRRGRAPAGHRHIAEPSARVRHQGERRIRQRAEDLKEQLPLQITITDVSGGEMRTTSGISIEDDGDGRLVHRSPEATGAPPPDSSSHVKTHSSVRVRPALRVRDGENEVSDVMPEAEGSIAPVPPDLAEGRGNRRKV